MCQQTGHAEVKSLYINELSTLLLVHTLVAGFTWGGILIDASNLERNTARAYKICIYLSFITAIVSIFYLVIQFTQLNVRMSNESVTKYFMDPDLSKGPLYSALLMILTLSLVLLASFFYAVGTESIFVYVIIIAFGCALYGWVLQKYIYMNSVVMKEFDNLIQEIATTNSTDMHKWFASNGLISCYPEIVSQDIHTIDDLRKAVKLMSVAEFNDAFNLRVGESVKIYCLLGCDDVSNFKYSV